MTHDVLGAILSRYPAIARPLAEPECLGNAGGGSGVRLWRYASGRGVLVARAWPSPGLRARLREMEALVTGGFDELAEALERGGDDPNRAAAMAWLAAARRLAPRWLGPLSRAAARSYALQPCVRDARPEHLL